MVKKRRLQLGISKLQLARKMGLPLRYIEEFEVGGGEGKERELALVHAFLRLPSTEIPERYMTPEDNRRTWEVAEVACVDWDLPMPPVEFRERVPCTLLQALAWARLLKDGAVTGVASPVEFGFWTHGLVDQYHNPIGIQPLPFISWDNPNWRYVLWPQVRARGDRRTYRVDALTLAAGWCNSRWAVMQLDGRQNRWDQALRGNLKLPVITPNTTDVHHADWRERLEALLMPEDEHRLVDGKNSLRDLLCGPSRQEGLLQLGRL